MFEDMLQSIEIKEGKLKIILCSYDREILIFIHLR